MSLTKLTENLNMHQSKPDKPVDTAQKLKEDFDKPVNDIKTYINDTLTSEIDTIVSNLQSTITTTQLNIIYPVGSIYLSVNNANPSTLFGGTWVAWGTGRVPVGINTSDTDFNTVEKIGGEKNHQLSTNELPTHNHTLNSHSHSIPSLSGYTDWKDLQGNIWNMAVQSQTTALSSNGIVSNNDPAGSKVGYAVNGYDSYDISHTDTAHINASHSHVVTTYENTTGSAGSGNTGNSGGSQAHNNLQPYITCYMWKRTA